MTDSSSTPSHEQIARRAYEIFVERGQPEGKDLDHWLEAESQLRAAAQTKRSTQTATSAQSTSAQPSAGSPIRATQMAAPSNGRTSNGRTPARTTARK